MNNIAPQRGLTLIELLVVVFIMMMFVAAAAPLVNPNNADRKIREASRQVNAYIAEAKAHAAQRNRPVGIAFDRATAVREGARDSNLVNRMYLVEVPPLYFGDITNSTVLVSKYNDDMPVGGITGATIIGNAPKKLQLQFDWRLDHSSGTPTPRNDNTGNSMVNPIFASYIPKAPVGAAATTFYIPFSIRFNNQIQYYPGVAEIAVDASYVPQSHNYYCFVEYGKLLYNKYPFGSGNTTPKMYIDSSFQLSFPPMMTGDTPLELPTGSVVDLQFSGTAASGDQFFDNTRANPAPTIVLFSPGGNVSAVLRGNSFVNAPGKCHFLLGSSKVAIEARDLTPANLANRNITNSILNDAASVWVSIGSQTGHVSTSDNIIPSAAEISAESEPNPVLKAIKLARKYATSLNSKGGR